jgi:hypothetical protein
VCGYAETGAFQRFPVGEKSPDIPHCLEMERVRDAMLITVIIRVRSSLLYLAWCVALRSTVSQK